MMDLTPSPARATSCEGLDASAAELRTLYPSGAWRVCRGPRPHIRGRVNAYVVVLHENGYVPGWWNLHLWADHLMRLDRRRAVGAYRGNDPLGLVHNALEGLTQVYTPGKDHAKVHHKADDSGNS